MILNLEQCQDVVKCKNAGMLSSEIAKKYDMPLYHVTLIMKCNRNRYPLNEYLLIDNTNQQRRSVYLYCGLLAKELNGRGLDMVKTLSDVDISWSKESVKEHIWAKVQNAKFGNVSVNDLETPEVSEIYDVVNRHLSNKFGVHVPFPSKENNG